MVGVSHSVPEGRGADRKVSPNGRNSACMFDYTLLSRIDVLMELGLLRLAPGLFTPGLELLLLSYVDPGFVCPFSFPSISGTISAVLTTSTSGSTSYGISYLSRVVIATYGISYESVGDLSGSSIYWISDRGRCCEREERRDCRECRL